MYHKIMCETQDIIISEYISNSKHDSKRIADFNYDKLNEFGYVNEGTCIVKNDIIIGKIIPKIDHSDNEKLYRDASLNSKSNSSSSITTMVPTIGIIETFMNDEYPIMRVKSRSNRSYKMYEIV